MADKKFGVKQINLIGASGTPTLTSPNNLNINAVNVAISTDLSVGGDVSIGGTFNALSVSGVSTFSGITTVTGETLFAKQLNVSGVSTFSTGISKGVEFVNESGGGTIRISNDGGNSQGRIGFNGSVDSTLYANYTNGDIDFVAGSIFSLHLGSYTNYALRAYNNSSVELNYSNSKKFETASSGVNIVGTTTTGQLSVTGVSTLTRVNVGTISSIFDLVDQGDDVPLLKIGNDLVLANIADPFFDPYRNWIYSDEYDLCVGTRGETGSNYNHIILVGIHTGNDQYDPNTSYVTLRYGNSQTKLTTTGYGVTISGDLNVSGVVTETAYYGDASRVVSGKWTLGANGTSNYTFDGVGVNAGNNYNTPMYLARGCVYEFVNNSGGSHPFQIRVSNGGAAYSTGVTNNGASSGTIRFEVPMDAPNSLYYQCTSHSGMGGTITVYPDAVV